MSQTNSFILKTCNQLIEIQIAIAFLQLTQGWNKESNNTKYEFYKKNFYKINSNQILLDFANSRSNLQADLQTIQKTLDQIILNIQLNYNVESKRILLKQLFQSMHEVFNIEESQNEKLPKEYFERFCFFRSFDFIDEIIGINYSLDINQKTFSLQKERLYEGAGVGVQSSYSTLYQIYKNVQFKENCSMIDLGSGYGRLGFYLNILRPDIHFTGFEFLDYRVNQACENLIKMNASKNTQFQVQDLSKDDFRLPEADFYYLYDPFTDSTYHLIMKKLVELSQRKNISIISKGNSKNWLRSIQEQMRGYQIRSLDNDHIVIIEKQTA